MSSLESDDKVIRDQKVKRKNLKKYTSKVFKESSVTAVSSILSTVDIRRKVFRMIVLILCLTGFLYQCIKFLEYAFQYPTDLEISIDKPTSLEVPAYTFCNDNGIVRSKYCAKYPDHCTLPDELVCKRYPKYCSANSTALMPKNEYYIPDTSMTLEEVAELGHNFSDFLPSASAGFNTDIPLENFEGPFLRAKSTFYGSRVGCYSLYSLVDSRHEPEKMRIQELFPEPANTFMFNVQPDEILIPGNRAGILFSIHSPYEAVNPFERGIFMKAGRTYKIYVSLKKEILLPLPYKTNCLNYTAEWIKNGRSGPRTKKMCIDKCLLEASLRMFNCSVIMILYPNKERVCLDHEWMEKINEEQDDDKLEECTSKCKEDCEKFKYTFHFQERYERDKPNETMEESGLISVQIYLDVSEVIRYQHRPQYRTVELFSYIGGYIGIWMGISLVELMDFLEALCRIFTYAFRKRTLNRCFVR